MSEAKVKNSKKSVDKTIYLQFAGQEVSLETVEADIMKDYETEKKGEDPAADIKIYLKPEDRKAYYVINNDYAGEVDLLAESK